MLLMQPGEGITDALREPMSGELVFGTNVLMTSQQSVSDTITTNAVWMLYVAVTMHAESSPEEMPLLSPSTPLESQLTQTPTPEKSTQVQ